MRRMFLTGFRLEKIKYRFDKLTFPFEDIDAFVRINGSSCSIHPNKYNEFSNQNNNFRQKILNICCIMFAVFLLMGHPCH